MKILLSIILLLSTATAFASFTGSFTGTAQAAFSSGRVYPCHEIFLRLETTPSLFNLRDGGYRCGDFLNASFDAFKLTIKDGNLLHLDEILGTLTDKELSYKIYDPEDGSTYHLRLTLTPDGIEYFEEWHDGEKIALTVQGVLKRQ